MIDKKLIDEKFSVLPLRGNTPEEEKKGVVYFIGIGGIGMSALARFFAAQGIRVSGYDKTPTPLTTELEGIGIPVHYEDRPDLAPRDADLVVYTPAIPADHQELVYYRNHDYKVVKRSDVLQLITESSFNICIAGTHGKTTITTMTAHLLRDSGFGCNAFLGGISVNYGTNFWSSERNVCVVEADEYDRSFLKLSPDIAVITAMDPDHLDIYGTPEAVEQAFIDFSARVRPGGLLIRQWALKRGNALKAPQELTYSLQNSNASIYATNLQVKEGSYHFDVVIEGRVIKNLVLNMGGLHNVENALAAIGVASSLEIDDDRIRKGVSSFKGVKRRFEYILRNRHLVYIDDYAHHPEELKALINGARSLFGQRQCTIIFQPHLYTRTKDLADEFAAALDLADETILLPIYPARELPIPGVTSTMVTERMKTGAPVVKTRQELLKWVEEEYGRRTSENGERILITAGAGDVDTLVTPIKNILNDLT